MTKHEHKEDSANAPLLLVASFATQTNNEIIKM